jgi:HEPN domain-containing protein
MLEDGDADAAGFFLQQAMEKFLKGWLVDHGWPLRKTHELDLLLDAAARYAPTLAVHRPVCERVSGYSMIDRYPSVGAQGADLVQVGIDREDARALMNDVFPDERLT